MTVPVTICVKAHLASQLQVTAKRSRSVGRPEKRRLQMPDLIITLPLFWTNPPTHTGLDLFSRLLR